MNLREVARHTLAAAGCGLLLSAAAARAQPRPPEAAAPARGAQAVAAAGSRPLAAPSGWSLEVPTRLVLGRDAHATLRYRVPEGTHARLVTSTGGLGDPVRLESGVWQVEYTPPAQKYPQVASLVLIDDADETRFLWRQIALHGVATVELRSDPQTEVEVQVAGVSFGPATTDARGKAGISVIVPPGVDEAISIASDALGNQRRQSIPIAVPEFQRLLSVCAQNGGLGFWVFAVNANGSPDAGALLELEVDPLLRRGITARGPGVYRVRLGIPEQLRAGDIARVSARLATQPTSAHGCALRVPLEHPNRIELRLSRAQFSAGEAQPIAVTITPHYAGKREPEAADLRFETTLGRLSESRLRSSTAVELLWYLPNDFGGLERAMLRARSGDVIASGTIALQAGRPSALTLEASDDQLAADGTDSTRLVLQARDAHGNPVRSAHFRASARGAVSAFEPVGAGQFEATYRAPDGGFEDSITVREVDSGALAAHAIRLRRQRGPLSLALRAGYLTNFAKISAPLLSLQVAYRLPFARERFQVGFEAGYYFSQDQTLSSDALDRVRTRVQGVPLSLRLAYLIEVGSFELWPFVAAGALISATELSAQSTGTAGSLGVAPLFAAGGGGSIEVGPGRAVLELGYLLAGAARELARGNAGGASLAAGYALRF